MTYLPTVDYALDVPRGNIPGVRGVNKFGRNLDIGTGPEDVWENGGTWLPPTQARIHALVSTQAADDGAPPGTGAQTVEVFGLTAWNLAEVSETVIMNGVGAVNTGNAYVIIHRMKVTAWGSAGPNVGIITATAAVDATITAQIDAGQGQTQMAIYGVPSIQTVYLANYYSSMLRAGGATALVDVFLLLNPIPDVQLLGYQVKHTRGMINAATSAYEHNFNPYGGHVGPLIFKIAAGASASSDISAGFNLYLVDNT